MHALIASLALAAAPAAKDCEWKEPKAPPTFTVEGGMVELRGSYDPKWFNCAKKAGGTLTAQVLLGPAGKLAVDEERKITSYGFSVTTGPGRYCKRDPFPQQVQVTLVGTGPMERLNFTSEALPVQCFKCEYRDYNSTLAFHVKNGLTPAGQITLDAGFDPEWHACAKPGSTLEMRFFPAATREEALKAKAPAFAIKGLEGEAKLKKAFPEAELCAGKPRWVGFEFFGTGELARVNGERGAFEPKCD